MKLSDLIPELLGRCLRAPDLDFDERKVSAFERMYASARDAKGVATIEYDCDFPKHEFLSHLVASRNVLLHGSNEKTMRYLFPLRQSSDSRTVGNLSAVYACSDGIWPIFFAIWDRRFYGATTNSCFWATDADGTLRKFYSFFIAAEGQERCGEAGAADRRCWMDGMVYILPRNSFTQLVDEAGNLLEEWASREPVPVLARLPVSPQDFLFLSDVSIREAELSPPPAPGPQVKIDAQVYDAYVGRYEVSPDLTLSLERKNGRLLLQAAGFPVVEIHPASETVYLLREINGQIAFVKNDKGEVTELTLQVNGKGLPARKIG